MCEPLKEEYGLAHFLSGELSLKACERVKREWAESLVEDHGFKPDTIGKVQAIVTLTVHHKPVYKKEDLL